MSLYVGIGLGSNVGDRLSSCRQAREMILAQPGILGHPDADAGCRCLSASLYETEPVGCPPGAAQFYNTVIEVALLPRCSPLHMLSALRQAEVSLGRPSRHPRNAPRRIDLDLLYAGHLQMNTAELTIPHPRLYSRGFVLVPLAEIRPELILPGQKKPVHELLRALPDTANVRKVLDRW